MRKLISSIVITCMAIMISSCSNEMEDNYSSSQNPRVVNLNEYLSAESRSSVSDADENVLSFKDEDSYNQTVAQLKAMSEDERLDYFKKIGFEGAYTIISRADSELESIFDMDAIDSLAVNSKIKGFLEKYKNVLVFNEEDEFDVTPSLSFDGEDIKLVGSLNGYVIIDNTLYQGDPGKDSSESESDDGISKMPYNGYFIEYDNVSVKNGSYTSYFRIGRKGTYIAFKTETCRKILFWKKYDKSCGYDGRLEIWDSRGNNKRGYDIKCGPGEWCLQGVSLSTYSPLFNGKITNFCSTRNSKNKKTKSFNNLLVR